MAGSLINNGGTHNERLPPELPPEIVVKILDMSNNVDTILRASEACRSFRDLVLSSTLLQFTLKLAKCGYVGSPNDARNASEKLASFMDYHKAWTELIFRRKDTFPLDNEAYLWDFTDGVWAQACSPSHLGHSGVRHFTFRELPSVVRKSDGKQWEIPDIGVDVLEFRMDPSQDLLVVVQKIPTSAAHQIGTIRHMQKIHFRSLSRDSAHVRASGDGVLTHIPSFGTPEDGWACSLEVYKDFFAILLFSADVTWSPNETLIIWNWVTGEKLAVLAGTETRRIGSFTILNQMHVLLCIYRDGERAESALELCSYAMQNGKPLTYNSPNRRNSLVTLTIFRLPTCKMHTMIATMVARNFPSGCGWSESHASFSPTPTGKILVIEMVILSGLDTEVNTLLTFSYHIRQRPFLDAANRAIEGGDSEDLVDVEVFPWEQWGPPNARIAHEQDRRPWICYMYGDRVCSSFHPTLQITSFNPSAVRGADLVPNLYTASELDYQPFPDAEADSELNYGLLPAQQEYSMASRCGATVFEDSATGMSELPLQISTPSWSVPNVGDISDDNIIIDNEHMLFLMRDEIICLTF